MLLSNSCELWAISRDIEYGIPGFPIERPVAMRYLLLGFSSPAPLGAAIVKSFSFCSWQHALCELRRNLAEIRRGFFSG
jgi:hypothetical protein